MLFNSCREKSNKETVREKQLFWTAHIVTRNLTLRELRTTSLDTQSVSSLDVVQQPQGKKSQRHWLDCNVKSNSERALYHLPEHTVCDLSRCRSAVVENKVTKTLRPGKTTVLNSSYCNEKIWLWESSLPSSWTHSLWPLSMSFNSRRGKSHKDTVWEKQMFWTAHLATRNLNPRELSTTSLDTQSVTSLDVVQQS